MIEFADDILLNLKSSVFVLGGQVQGMSDGMRIFLIISMFRLIFFLILVKFLEILQGVFYL